MSGIRIPRTITHLTVNCDTCLDALDTLENLRGSEGEDDDDFDANGGFDMNDDRGPSGNDTGGFGGNGHNNNPFAGNNGNNNNNHNNSNNNNTGSHQRRYSGVINPLTDPLPLLINQKKKQIRKPLTLNRSKLSNIPQQQQQQQQPQNTYYIDPIQLSNYHMGINSNNNYNYTNNLPPILQTNNNNKQFNECLMQSNHKPALGHSFAKYGNMPNKYETEYNLMNNMNMYLPMNNMNMHLPLPHLKLYKSPLKRSHKEMINNKISDIHNKHKRRRLNGVKNSNKVRRKKKCDNKPSMINIETKLNGGKKKQNNNNNNNNKNSNIKSFPIGDTNRIHKKYKKKKKKKKKKSEEVGNNEYSDSDENKSKYVHLGKKQLKKLCKDKMLHISGTKKDLLQRLNDLDNGKNVKTTKKKYVEGTHYGAIFTAKNERDGYICNKCGKWCAQKVEIERHYETIHIKNADPWDRVSIYGCPTCHCLDYSTTKEAMTCCD